MRNAKAIAAVLLIFLLGAATGGLIAHRIYQKRIEGVVRGGPGAMVEMILKRMDRDLKLDGTQREAIRKIVQETHGEMRQIRLRFRPQMQQILSRSEERIRQLLRPEQREVFEQMNERRKKQWDEHPDGPPFGNPPPP